MELINPLFFPILPFLAVGLAIAAVIMTVVSIQYRNDPNKVKRTWLKLAILFAVVISLIGTGAFGKWGLLPVFLFLAYQGWVEFTQCVETKFGEFINPRLIISLGTAGVLGGLGPSFSLFSGIVMSTGLALSLPMLIYRKPSPMYELLGVGFGMFFITIPLAILLTLIDHSYGEFSLLIFLVNSNDAFAQGLGLIKGKIPLAPSISPGKTVEGAIGGLSFCLVTGYLMRFLVADWQVWQVLFMAGLVALMALCGDLIASSLKREAGIKDFSQILNVTGGVLDKFDSLMFSAPIFYIVAIGIDNFSMVF